MNKNLRNYYAEKRARDKEKIREEFTDNLKELEEEQSASTKLMQAQAFYDIALKYVALSKQIVSVQEKENTVNLKIVEHLRSVDQEKAQMQVSHLNQQILIAEQGKQLIMTIYAQKLEQSEKEKEQQKELAEQTFALQERERQLEVQRIVYQKEQEMKELKAERVLLKNTLHFRTELSNNQKGKLQARIDELTFKLQDAQEAVKSLWRRIEY